MFTLQQIKTAHAKVKSGADFPAYIAEIKALGIRSYSFYVTDGHTDYKGFENFKLSSESKYPELDIAHGNSIPKLKTDLKAHQQGKTDYLTFCKQAADAGVEKWTVDMIKMTCAYYDKSGNEMLVEEIPDVK